MDKTWMSRWEKARAKGKIVYIFGVTLCFTLLGILYAIFGHFTSNAFNNFAEFFWGIFFHICTFFVIGLVFGVIMWGTSEKKYNKLLKDE